MKKIKRVFAITLLFMSFISVGTQSKELEVVFSEEYCASSANNCGGFSYCGSSVDEWIAVYEVVTGFCNMIGGYE